MHVGGIYPCQLTMHMHSSEGCCLAGTVANLCHAKLLLLLLPPSLIQH